MKAIAKINRLKPCCAMSEFGCGYAKGVKDAIDILNATPSADVQPVMQGRCVIDNEGYERCSVCNEHETGLRYFTFCPRCGARLDGETE